MDMKNNVVAYIDLLAFSNHIRENTSDALMAMNNYNTILSSKIRDEITHPVNSYPPVLQELAKKHSIDSFDFFLPFSDSVFLMSGNCNDFIKQLGSFVLQSFTITAHFYEHPIDPSVPEKGKILNCGINTDGSPKVEYGECNYYPALFRGGLAYGEAMPIELFSIVEKKYSKSKVITGEAVVEAVRLESKVKGPRLMFKQILYNQLDDDTKDFCRVLPENKELYEILWPAMIYVLQHEEFQNKQEFSRIYDLFTPAYNLWKAYNHTIYSAHYFNFIELIVASTLQYFDKKCNLKSFALEEIKKILDKYDISGKLDLSRY